MGEIRRGEGNEVIISPFFRERNPEKSRYRHQNSASDGPTNASKSFRINYMNIRPVEVPSLSLTAELLFNECDHILYRAEVIRHYFLIFH